MNARKDVDYSDMFAALDALLETNLPQMERYYEIGRLVSDRPEKGAAVAAAEYLQSAFPETPGFSPRSLRRMREFYRIYESAPEIMSEAMALGWTQNIVIFEANLTLQERLWYIRATLRFGWSKSMLIQQIAAAAHLSLDLSEEMCYTKKNASSGDVPDYVDPQSSQCDEAGSSGATDGFPATLFVFSPNFFYRRIHTETVLVCRWCGRSVGIENGIGPPGRGGLRQTVLQKAGLVSQ